MYNGNILVIYPMNFKHLKNLQMNKQVGESFFGATDPYGSLCHALPEPRGGNHVAVAQISSLEPPRMLYYQFASYTEYIKIHARSRAYPNRRSGAEPLFMLLEHSQRVLRMQAAINDRLEARIQMLEQTLAQLQLLPAANTHDLWVEEESLAEQPEGEADPEGAVSQP